jgi:hypothetical protein
MDEALDDHRANQESASHVQSAPALFKLGAQTLQTDSSSTVQSRDLAALNRKPEYEVTRVPQPIPQEQSRENGDGVSDSVMFSERLRS